MKTCAEYRTPTKRPPAALLFATCLLASRLVVHAAPGDLDLSFRPGSAINERVLAMARQNDGKWIIAGGFTAVQGMACGRVARLNVDGSTDHGFMAGLTGANLLVHAVAVQSDGKILIGGLFNTVHGTQRTKLARLNPDGSLDSTFGHELTGVDSLFAYVNAVAVQTDGKILVGGNFTSVNGVTRNNIARLNADGTVDTTFGSGLAGAGNEVSSIVLQPDGKIVISGYFDSVNATARGHIARLLANGTLDTSFGNGLAGADAVVFSVALQTDGRIVVGGAFSLVNSTPRSGVARLNTNGSLDLAFGNRLAGTYFVRSVALQNDAKILIGGEFTSVNGTARTNIARLNSDATLDTSFGNDAAGTDKAVRCLAVQAGGLIILGGEFVSVDGTPRNRLAALHADGAVAPEFDNGQHGPNGNILSLAALADGKVLIGGVFTAVDGQTRNRIARLHNDGSLDGEFGGGLPGANRDINVLALQSDGKILLGGTFTAINGTTRNRVARLNADGTLDTAFGHDLAGASSTVNAIAIQEDGKMVIGGAFTLLNGRARNCIARLNTDGSLDPTFGEGLAGADAPVYSVALQADGKIIMGGQFDSVNETPRGRVARLNADGTLDPTFGDGVSGVETTGDRADIVLALLEQRDGKILVGGDFALINGVPRSGLARLNADGTLDTAFGDGLAGVQGSVIARVRSFCEQSDGKILVGGFFTSINGLTHGGLARLNADGTPDTGFGNGLAGADGSVRTTALRADGKMVIGGEFTSVNRIPGNGVALLHTEYLSPVLGIDLGGARPGVRISAERGQRYVLEYLSELFASDTWTALPVFTVTNSPQTVVDTTARNDGQRFYRARLVP